MVLLENYPEYGYSEFDASEYQPAGHSPDNSIYEDGRMKLNWFAIGNAPIVGSSVWLDVDLSITYDADLVSMIDSVVGIRINGVEKPMTLDYKGQYPNGVKVARFIMSLERSFIDPILSSGKYMYLELVFFCLDARALQAISPTHKKE